MKQGDLDIIAKGITPFSVIASTATNNIVVPASSSQRVRIWAINFTGGTSTANHAAWIGDTTTVKYFYSDMQSLTSQNGQSFTAPFPLTWGATCTVWLATTGAVAITVLYDLENKAR